MPHFIHSKGAGGEPPPPLPEFDFAVIRYNFTEEDGRDLDTRTALVDVDPAFNGRDVGYARYGDGGGSSGAIIGNNFTDYFLYWGGDNMGYGVEACLVDFKRIASAFPALSEIKVRMRAFWYSQKNSGNIQLQFETYLGGTMQHSGYDFINIGGELVTSLEVPRNVETQTSGYIDGDDLGFLVYDIATKEGSIIPP